MPLALIVAVPVMLVAAVAVAKETPFKVSVRFALRLESAFTCTCAPTANTPNTGLGTNMGSNSGELNFTCKGVVS